MLNIWGAKWMTELNAEKCHVLKMIRSMHRPHATYNLGGVEVQSTKEKENDLGLVVQDNL